eukprot:CAMPEP_0119274768 /NCGR_PEP_ID=MMETSP1329-20130426/12673_1 /TAXON_ID=114041 /ORGANISM="Genus nov. species nov., Strain RCC1024" /LENGTH=44 /DNA_ID= /DNA_START= /DNA_END= /DNA_ORIENTATION=
MTLRDGRVLLDARRGIASSARVEHVTARPNASARRSRRHSDSGG